MELEDLKNRIREMKKVVEDQSIEQKVEFGAYHIQIDDNNNL